MDSDNSVPDWVIEHPETLAVFQEFGIDCSCGGKSLEFACREQGLDVQSVLEALRRRIEGEETMSESTQPEEKEVAIPHAVPAELIDVRPLGAALATTKTSTLFKTGKMEVIRLVMPAGKEISEHKAGGEITVQCLEGRIAFTALGKTQELTAGQMLYLAAAEPHSVRCVEDASFLVTILLNS